MVGAFQRGPAISGFAGSLFTASAFAGAAAAVWTGAGVRLMGADGVICGAGFGAAVVGGVSAAPA